MPYGSCRSISELPPPQSALLTNARRGVLSTAGEDGFPHSVPVVFVVAGEEIVSPIDEKPKRSRDLVRLRNIAAQPAATLLVDHWDEDWKRLGWVMVRASARVEAGNPTETELRTRYPQYEALAMSPGDRSIVLAPRRISWWSWE